MTEYVYLTFLMALTVVYALFLDRVRQGLDFLLAGRQDVTEDRGPVENRETGVTVIVPARNEAARLPALIASLKAQTHPAELCQYIIVDDHSSDDTARTALREWGDDPRFLLIRLADDDAGGKKRAIAEGVAAAQWTIIVTTDADCVHHPGWITSMTACFRTGIDMVAGPVVYPRNGGLFARLQALEFLGLMGVGAGLFGVGYPRLCNGANLAFLKRRFSEAAVYRQDDPVASGDDEFLLHAIVYRLGGTAVFSTDQESIVVTEPAGNVAAFFSQRARWASKGFHYRDSRFVAFLLLLFAYLAMLAFAPLGAAGSVYAVAIASLLFACKVSLDLRVLMRAARLFQLPVRAPDLIIAEFLHPAYLVAASLAGTFWNVPWKNRRIRNRRST